MASVDHVIQSLTKKKPTYTWWAWLKLSGLSSRHTMASLIACCLRHLFSGGEFGFGPQVWGLPPLPSPPHRVPFFFFQENVFRFFLLFSSGGRRG